MKHIHTFESFVNEALNEALSSKTSAILKKIKDVASGLRFSEYTTLASLKTAVKGTMLEDSIKKYEQYDGFIAAYLLIDANHFHLLVISSNEENPEEIDIDFYKKYVSKHSSGQSSDSFIGNEESKTWQFKKTWKEWFVL